MTRASTPGLQCSWWGDGGEVIPHNPKTSGWNWWTGTLAPFDHRLTFGCLLNPWRVAGIHQSTHALTGPQEFDRATNRLTKVNALRLPGMRRSTSTTPPVEHPADRHFALCCGRASGAYMQQRRSKSSSSNTAALAQAQLPRVVIQARFRRC